MAGLQQYPPQKKAPLQRWITARDWLQQMGLIYSLTVLLLVLVFYISAVNNWLPHNPEDVAFDAILSPPFSQNYLLGTDFLGRDILTRLMLGTQAYFIPGLLAISLAVLLGGLIGAISAFRFRLTRQFIGFFNNTLQSMPRLVILFLFIAIFEPDIYLIMLIIGTSHIPSVAKIVSNRINSLKERSFIDSAIASGLPTWKILIRHILWFNCRGILIGQASLIMSEAILMEVSLSYLGFGVQEPDASWGNMIQAGANYIMQGQIWSSTVPAIATMLVLSALYVLGHRLINSMEQK